jgi:hypothetical protein
MKKHLSKRVISTEGQEKIRLAGFNQWLKNAKKTHGDLYDYTHSYQKFRVQKQPKIIIYCKKHGEDFLVTPFDHLRAKSAGCKKCDSEQASNYFISREWGKFKKFFDKNLSDRLDMQSEFKGMTTDMTFFCKIHRITSKHKPTFLMNNKGYGCTECSKPRKNRLTLTDIEAEFKYLLPENVKILSVEFNKKTQTSNVRIKCSIHGEQLTTKGYLKKSQFKCPSCGNESVGYAGYRLQSLIESGNKGRATFIGVMKIEVFGIESLKVGVTTRTLEERYKWNLKEIYFSAQLSEVDAYVMENQIHRAFKRNHDLRILKAGMRSGERWGGDTECYWPDKQSEIIRFISNYIKKISKIDYKKELALFEVPNFFPRDVSREKNESNKPIPVIGVDPVSLKIITEFKSISDATRAGYKNISLIISNVGHRQIANGLRWFKKNEFNPSKIKPLSESRRGGPKRIICLESNEVFESITNAESALRKRGIKISGSHISSACKGKRKIAGGFHWSYAKDNMEKS